MADERIINFQLDRDQDLKMQQALERAGISKKDDLGSGRADAGLISQMMGEVDPEIAPLLAEKVMRDAQWKMQATGPEQPEPAPSQEPAPEAPKAAPDELTSAKAALEAAQREAAEWKEKYGKRENVLGDVRKRLQELESRAQHHQGYQQPQYQAPYPAMLGQKPPDEPVTQAEVINLLLAQSAAFGNQLQQTYAQAIETARRLGSYTLTPAEEADLQEENPWLLRLPPGEREQAMMKLHKTAEAQPKAAVTPTGVRPEELARARIRSAGSTYIEPSSRATEAELTATAPAALASSKKFEDLKAALATPGGSEKAEEIIAGLSSGVRRT